MHSSFIQQQSFLFSEHAWDSSILTTARSRSVIPELDEDGDGHFNSRSLTGNQKLVTSASASLVHKSPQERLPVSSSPMPPSNPPTKPCSPAAMFLSSFSNATPTIANPDDEGQVISGYTLGPTIGYGSSSIIRRACSASAGTVAVKIVRRADLVKAGNAPQARKRLQHEADIWSSLSHEYILPLFSAVQTPYADYFFTLLCPAGSLFDILKRDGTPALPQDDAGMIIRQVVGGLRYLHEVARIVHRDMKLENVLVDEMGLCRIGDFGMTRKIGALDDEDEDDEEQHEPLSELLPPRTTIHRAVSMAVPSSKKLTATAQLSHVLDRHHNTRHRNSTSTNQPVQPFQPGSLPYAAPELLLPQTSDAMRAHPGQDVWALGVMLYTLLTGRLPFSDSFEPRLQMKILNGAYEMPQDIGRTAERILQGCLERNLANRWTIAQVDGLAWGVGWGTEGDDATPSEEQEEIELLKSASTNRSRSRPPAITIPSDQPDWQQDEPRSRPALEAASRRSSSRAKRSISRAPIYSERSPSLHSGSRSLTRRSRASSPTPLNRECLSALSTASDDDESALIVSPSSPHPPRGRRPSRPQHSRSPSPSLAPTTPLDNALVPLTGTMDYPDELFLDPTRGRAPMRPSLPDSAYIPGKGAAIGAELAEWTSQDELDSSAAHGSLFQTNMREEDSRPHADDHLTVSPFSKPF